MRAKREGKTIEERERVRRWDLEYDSQRAAAKIWAAKRIDRV